MINSARELFNYCANIGANGIHEAEKCKECEANPVCDPQFNYQEIFDKLIIYRRKQKLKKLLS